MTIKEAKQELMNTVRAYLMKDESGMPLIPVEKQRPVLLMGPPGIGKTAIMEQVAAECGIGLISYTITHHTRQSAIGLPFIEKKTYEGREYEVTEYTMSEIIASIYEQIERTGVKEGILFLDEINCVSETLAPTMLQFLQYKTFGTHHIPDGFLIVTAGNPPQYNRSVRDFDIVTLDRLKRIDIEEDYPAFKEYARKAMIHGAILAYLEIRGTDFYSIRKEVEETYFVTARGWEDLSRMLYAYEKLGLPVDEKLVVQYLQDPEIAGRFATYYALYNKYQNVYRIPDILAGQIPETTKGLRNAPFDEKLSLIGLTIDSLSKSFREFADHKEVQRCILGILKAYKNGSKEGQESLPLTNLLDQEEGRIRKAEKDHLQGREGRRIGRLALTALRDFDKKRKMDRVTEDKTYEAAKTWFAAREEERLAEADQTSGMLTNAFSFMNQTFGKGQEMVIFLTELSSGYYSLNFIRECGNEAYYKYNEMLLLKDRESELRSQVQEALSLN